MGAAILSVALWELEAGLAGPRKARLSLAGGFGGYVNEVACKLIPVFI